MEIGQLMVPEIGHFALILALCVALVQSVLPVVGAARNIPGWIAVARPAAYTQLLFVAIAYICLTYAFITNDFSVAYTATNSNSRLPLLFRISGVWGAHEGSLLLWGLVLAVWTGAVARFSRSVPEAMLARVVGVMGMVSVGFLLFMLFTSSPFERLLPAAMEGRDLNPLLQDVGLVRPCCIWDMSVFPFHLRLRWPLCCTAGWIRRGRAGHVHGPTLRGCF
jgi:cytochrome c-type biogenesis protein CcmF